MSQTQPRFSDRALRRRSAPPRMPARSVEVPVPLWASTAGLAGGVAFCVMASVSDSPFETVALLAGAAAAGGLGVYGLLERLARRRHGAEWAVGGSARALIDGAHDPMAVIDKYGRIIALNSAARALGEVDRAPSRAAHLLREARSANELVYRLLGAALGGRPADAVVETGEGRAEAISVWPIGGELALWRQGAASEKGGAQLAQPARSAAQPGRETAPMGGAAAATAEIGWFRVDAAGRLVEIDRIFSRWLGARARSGPLSLRTVLPEARLGGAGGEAMRSRLIGAPGAPRDVAVLITPLGQNGESVGVASAASTQGMPTAAEAGGETVLELGAARRDALFEATPYGVLLLGEDGRIEAANVPAERMLAAIGHEGPVGGPSPDFLFDWIDEKDAERVRRAFAAGARGARGAEATLTAQWAASDDAASAGRPAREVEIAFRPYRDGQERERVAAFLQDASERLGLERSMAQAQKMQAVGVLAGGMAHDLNNMLAVIIGGSDMLVGRKTADDPDVAELQVIQQSAQRAATLVTQLLLSSRKQRLDPSVANLTEVISDLGLMLNRALSDKWFLQRDLAEDIWPAMVDVNHLGHAVMNLVVNARDAMPKGGKIILRTSNAEILAPQHGPDATMPPGAYVRLDVIDEGVGMPPDVLNRIFEPFFTTKKVGKGTGLGLSMVYGIIKQSQGYLFVDSAPGQGARFSIYLPRCSEEMVEAHEEAKRDAAARAERAVAAAGRQIILLVEDEAAVRNMAATALRERGYQVIEAADGGEALEVLEREEQHIDLMLSDVVMPDMDGPAVLKALGDRRPEMRTVFMTGYARDSFAETLDDAFAKRRDFGLLQKPFRLPALYQAVAEALGAE